MGGGGEGGRGIARIYNNKLNVVLQRFKANQAPLERLQGLLGTNASVQ